METNTQLQSLILGGGCFWCVEAVFQNIRGVKSVESGYSGGNIKDPTYREICSGLTGHAEVCKIVFDPNVIKEEELLKVFFTTHDPTTLNRQGNDRGTQYRSVIYFNSEEQKQLAEKIRDDFAPQIWDDPIVTEISPLGIFYPAEAYHQNYYNQNPNQGYCNVIIAPKVAKFRKQYAKLLNT